MKMFRWLGVLAVCALSACSKSSEPDNAVTRYGQSLVDGERRAEDAAAKANAAIERQQRQINQAEGQQ